MLYFQAMHFHNRGLENSKIFNRLTFFLFWTTTTDMSSLPIYLAVISLLIIKVQSGVFRLSSFDESLLAISL